MYARRSHLPSCDAIPNWGRRRARFPRALKPFVEAPVAVSAAPLMTASVITALAATLLVPLAAQAQAARARDLSIIEDVLVETIQDAIQVTVRAVNTENLEVQEAARQNEQPPPIRYIFRSGGQTQARGMFLEDYGAIFTVQVPSMSYTNSAIFGWNGNVAVVRPGSVEAMIANALGEDAQLRAQMSRMDSEIGVLRQRLEREVGRGGESSESAQLLQAKMTAAQQAFDEAQRAYSDFAAQERAAAEERRRSVSSADSREDTGERPGRFDGLRVLTNASAEEIAAAEELAQQQRNQIEGAIIDSVVETLARYGRIMHGLEEEDRLAVVLLPSSYLNPIGSWLRATERDQEFIISVRFRDVLEFDRNDLDEAEFRGRVRIERRQSAPPRQE